MDKREYHEQLRRLMEELLEKKLLVINYNWITRKTSIGVLRLYKHPEPWEILRINKNELILQMFMATSYPCGEATKNWLKDSECPLLAEDDRVIEILQSSICNVIEVMD